jgi:hypothetical protein
LCIGDLSEFNILVDSAGPVIIDLPQAVDAAGNNHAPGILERDVVNLRNYFGRYVPELLATDYGKEIWALYEAGALQSDTPLTGRFERIEKAVDLDSVMQEIEDARFEEEARDSATRRAGLVRHWFSEAPAVQRRPDLRAAPPSEGRATVRGPWLTVRVRCQCLSCPRQDYVTAPKAPHSPGVTSTSISPSSRTMITGAAVRNASRSRSSGRSRGRRHRRPREVRTSARSRRRPRVDLQLLEAGSASRADVRPMRVIFSA